MNTGDTRARSSNPTRSALVLASSSPRRSRILADAGFKFTVEPSRAEEVHVSYCSAREITLWNAHRKAREVAARFPGATVIGADTLVTIDGSILGKPRSLAEARAMLAMLSGRTHGVFTGVAILNDALRTGFTECSEVTLHPLDAGQVDRYISEVDPLDKAGAYGAQETSSVRLVSHIEGSLANVYGLPIETLTAILSAHPVYSTQMRHWRSP